MKRALPLPRPAATYTNFVGRTVKRVREDAALHEALVRYLGEVTRSEAPRATQERLARAVRERGPALTPDEPGPLLWELQWVLRYALTGGALLAGGWLVLGTPLVLLVPVYLYRLRKLEESNPVIVPRVDEDHVRALTSIEDYDLVDQFSAFGAVKPGDAPGRDRARPPLVPELRQLGALFTRAPREIGQSTSPAGCSSTTAGASSSRATTIAASRRMPTTS